jgi:phytoene dehydrogenase-like protein
MIFEGFICFLSLDGLKTIAPAAHFLSRLSYRRFATSLESKYVPVEVRISSCAGEVMAYFHDSKPYDTVIVGSGIAGLAAAKRIASAGHKVAVIERAQHIGGHLLPFKRGGQVFEVGLHYLADCGPGSHWQRALHELGVSIVTDALDPGFERIIGNKVGTESSASFTYPIAAHQAAMRARFPDLALHPNGCLDRFFRDLELVWNFANSLEFPLTIGSIVRHATTMFWNRPRQLQRILHLALQPAQRYFYDELKLPSDAAELFLLHHVLSGSDPAHLSAIMYLLVHRYYFENPCFVRGGGQAIIDALMDSSVDYFTGDPVTCVDSNETVNVTGVRYVVSTATTRFHCRNLVWTPDPRLLRSCARFELPLLLRARLSRAANPHALVVGYFVTSKNLNEIGFANANYWLAGKWSASASYHQECLSHLAKSSPVYLSTGSLRDKSLHRENRADENVLRGNGRFAGQGVIQAMFLVPPRWDLWAGFEEQGREVLPASGIAGAEFYRKSAAAGGFRRDYLSIKKEVLESLTSRIMHAFPSLRNEIVWRELGTPLTHHRFLNSSSLGGYGFASTIEDLIWSRPSYRSGRAGLYLAGAFTLPSHGIVTALLSGVGVGRSIAGNMSKEQPVR